jgi:hypothetical protein
MQDSQNHCMLCCKRDKDLDSIRRATKIKQDAIAHGLLKRYTKPVHKHLTREFLTASWTEKAKIQRVWLELWTTETLRAMILPAIEQSDTLTMPKRTV